ncbi:MAG: glycosyltransferase [Frankiaceae bacterium]|nr:glycosyltransferase [Frankiaceae bacterium]
MSTNPPAPKAASSSEPVIPARGDTENGAAPLPSYCIVGSGWAFTSGVSYYTCRLTHAFADRHRTSAILMRRLIPRVFYPGRDRVGRPLNNLDYGDHVPVFDGIDWWWLPSLWRALRFLRAQRPDVVVLQWWTAAIAHSYLVLAIVARRLGATVVVEFHETADTGETRLPLVGRYVRLVGRAIFRRCGGIVVHSEFDRAEVVAHYPVGHLPVRVAPHGPFDHHVPAETEAGADGGDFTVLFFGTIRPYKGLEHLVEAFDSLSDDEVAGMRLLVVGEPWEGWTKPLELIAAARHRDRIALVDRYVHDDEVASYFTQADAVVLPYLRSSASGPLHIAMSAGLPVVLTDVGGLRAAAGDYAGAVWVPPTDPAALRTALLDLPSRRGERYADPRSWSDTVAAYDDLMREARGR